MATQVGKAGDMTFGRGTENIAAEKPKSYQDLGLCLALVVLLVWALFVGFRGVNWPAVSHAFRALVALIR
jgi:hypothetical protein